MPEFMPKKVKFIAIGIQSKDEPIPQAVFSINTNGKISCTTDKAIARIYSSTALSQAHKALKEFWAKTSAQQFSYELASDIKEKI